ncbi:hypothetical protein IJG91_01085 [Candidatus Saccharibacteria bacterium]|nr:hypothetical protein [Candidatus Saccharibacteria bacterium]
MGKFALGEEKLARQIFPIGVDMNITPLGSNGFIAGNFSAVYPKRLSIFIPIDYVTNRFSNNIPAEFESFFRPLDDFLNYYDRLTEIDCRSDFVGKGVECAIGKFSDFDYKGERHDTFAISPNAPSGTVTLLCRRLVRGGRTVMLSEVVHTRETTVAEEAISEVRGILNPSFLDVADSLKVEEDLYIYWSMKPSQIFVYPELAMAGLMLSTPTKTTR